MTQQRVLLPEASRKGFGLPVHWGGGTQGGHSGGDTLIMRQDASLRPVFLNYVYEFFKGDFIIIITNHVHLTW